MHFDDFHEVIDKHRKTDEQDLNFSVGDKYPEIIIESITLNAIYIEFANQKLNTYYYYYYYYLLLFLLLDFKIITLTN